MLSTKCDNKYKKGSTEEIRANQKNEGKKTGVFFSHSKKGPVFEQYRLSTFVTKFVVRIRWI